MLLDATTLHTTIEPFQARNGKLCVGGLTIDEIARNVGSTPFYVYDGGLIEKRVQALRAALPDKISLHYAIKANPMPEVVALLSGLVDGLDVASAGELEIACRMDTPRRDISFAGPGKSIPELAAAIDAEITLNVESETELSRIVEIARSAGKRPRVAIRVNPDFELKSSGMKMAGGPKQFGIDAERVPEILSQLGKLPVVFAGFHIFSGSQNLRPDAICESQQKAVQLALELARHAPSPPEMINVGGGFGVPYFRGDKPLELESIGENLELLAAQVAKRFDAAELVLELGRYFVAEAGVYVCQVLDRKISRGQVFLVTNGGLHHHLAASGNFGQVIRKNYPVAIANKLGETETETASVVGPLCTPLDLLADKMTLAKADIDDYVAIFQSGAYGYTASPHNFLGHPPPREILV